jgi:hypothetical protein
VNGCVRIAVGVDGGARLCAARWTALEVEDVEQLVLRISGQNRSRTPWSAPSDTS